MSKFDLQALIEASLKARKFSYSPYSKFKVGAAVLCGSGNIYTGANIENASYPVTICAERVAYGKAISEGESKFVAICITSSSTKEYCLPCGMCRQFMSEFGLDTQVICAKSKSDYKCYTLKELLPGNFDKNSMK